MSQPTAVSLVYFGKIPSRGDFVRSSQQGGLIQTLDRWLTPALSSSPSSVSRRSGAACGQASRRVRLTSSCGSRC